ncbi:hypothetical protein FLAG1_10099 [Fusarium langsethiae]|uniref:Uncharacterized protein n=1 Tax=Fusarium langsethiae TaxID=179993 RepID=A0A0N1J2B0_FUSLA|nr:hypothetical protein FLAG1_10099 [Fusarium langsethiae]GKU08056.1 unnamed protein product [Fusarium langsethiae]GKU09155.1 unnamed protein product [Fusarium langsethiae]
MNPDSSDDSQRTPLYFAAERSYTGIRDTAFQTGGNGHVDIVDRLLAAGTDATILDLWQRTPLRFAAMKGRVAIVRMLLERTNIQHDTPDWIDRAVLHIAANFLRDVGRKTGKTGGGTALHEAIRRETGQPPPSKALIRRLIEAGVPVNEVDSNEKTALFYANLKSNAAIVKVLLDEGATPDSGPSSTGAMTMIPRPGSNVPCRVVDIWALNNRPSLVNRVVAELETWEYDRHCIPGTVLMRAIFGGHIDVVKHILYRLPDTPLQAEQYEYLNALSLASALGHAEIVAMLIKAGPIVDAGTDKQISALHYAAKYGHTKVVAQLLDP